MEEKKRVSSTERYKRVPADRINKMESKVFTFKPSAKGDGKSKTVVSQKAKPKQGEAPAKTKTPEQILKEKYDPTSNLSFLSNLKYNINNTRKEINPVVISQMQNNKLARWKFFNKVYKIGGIGLGAIGIGALISAGAWPVFLLAGGIIGGVFAIHKLCQKFNKPLTAWKNSVMSKVIFDKHRADRIKMSMLEQCSLAIDKAKKVINKHEASFAKCSNMNELIISIDNKHKELEKATKTFYKQASKLGKLITKTKDTEVKAEYIDALSYISANITSLENIKVADQEILSQVEQEVKEIALANLRQQIQENQASSELTNSNNQVVVNLDAANDKANSLVDDIFAVDVDNAFIADQDATKTNLTPTNKERESLGISEEDISSIFEDLSKEDFEPTKNKTVKNVTLTNQNTTSTKEDEELLK